LPWERDTDEFPEAGAGTPNRDFSPERLWESFLRGGYPELAAAPERDFELWHGSYVQTYLERDVRNLRHVGDLSQFQAFLRALAARSAQLLNLSELARDLGVAVNTALWPPPSKPCATTSATRWGRAMWSIPGTSAFPRGRV